MDFSRPGLRRASLLVLVLLFWFLALSYACQVPPLHGPDEPAHFDFAWRLSQGQPLPVMVITGLSEPLETYVLDDPFIEHFALFGYSYEVYQPPAYYLALALAGQLGPTDNGIAPLTYYWRIVSVMMITLLIPLGCALVRLLLPDRPLWAFLVPALSVLNPGFVYYSSLVTNTTLGVVLTVLILYLVVRWFRQDQLKGIQVLALGILLGLAVLAKLTAATLPFVIAVAALATAWRTGNWGKWLTALVSVGGVSLMVTGWWFWRNLQIYGDLTASNALFIYAGDARYQSSWAGFRNLTREFVHTYFLGWQSVPHDWYIIVLVSGIAGLAISGMFIRWWRFYKQKPGQGQKQFGPWYVGLHAISLTIFVLWLCTAQYLLAIGEARLIYPAAVGLSMLVMLGLEGWMGARKATGVGFGLAVIFCMETLIRLQIYTI